jgi:hypothetical protein
VTKFLLGVAVGFVFSDVIGNVIVKVSDALLADKPDESPTTSEEIPVT